MLPVEFFDDSFNLARAIDRDALDESTSFSEPQNIGGMSIGGKFYSDAQIVDWMNDANKQLLNYYARKRPIGMANVNGSPVPIYRRVQ